MFSRHIQRPTPGQIGLPIVTNRFNYAGFGAIVQLGLTRYNFRLTYHNVSEFDIQRHPHRYNSGYYVEVKDDSDKNYYCKEKDENKAG